MPHNKRSQLFVHRPQQKPRYNKAAKQNELSLLLNHDRDRDSNSQLTTVFSLFLLATYVTPSQANCIPPRGSYTKTCHVKVEPSIADKDPSPTAMCRYSFYCKRENREHERTSVNSVYIPKNLVDNSFIENCDGFPVVRATDESVCTTHDAIIDSNSYLGM
ncbi:hypothetical protein ACNVED_01725 [Legionella sp. D16C41]|uniref:hypothetical protein n=1 Tax=Legionella sp. D16C41 TaxID=3402688 RepID=UPI003AF5F6B2